MIREPPLVLTTLTEIPVQIDRLALLRNPALGLRPVLTLVATNGR
jgi:hypothetical protein